MPSKNETIFHLKLGNIELSAAAKSRIETKLQEAVLSELAYYPNPDDDTKPRKKPPVPHGYVIVPLIDKIGKYILQLRGNDININQVIADQRKI